MAEQDIAGAPEWIRVAQDGNGPHGGFWTCAAATANSPKYIRADLHEAALSTLQAERDAARAESDGFVWAANHWRDRAIAAEARVAKLEAALRGALGYLYNEGVVGDLPDTLRAALTTTPGESDAG